MASVKKKSNGSYLIRVFRGYGADGKQNEFSKIFVPPEGMSDVKIQKALAKAAVDFEREVKDTLINVGDLRLKELIELWFKEQNQPVITKGKKVKKTTLSGYKGLTYWIYTLLGHIRVKKMGIEHLDAFYVQLQQPGIRRDSKYRPIVNLGALLDNKKLSRKKAAGTIGISERTIYALFPAKRAKSAPGNTMRTAAEKICGFLGQTLDELLRP
ncbi:MAG TPA: hypothetical protein DEB31_02095 [Clostridiales bacterium]|nr:hypothetical protein [Clostridiales bacterium]